MNIKPLLFASALSLLAGSVWAQSTSKPLNLNLPGDVPASSSTAGAPASSSTTASTSAGTTAGSNIRPPATKTANIQPISTTPGVYYGDTSGRLGDNGTASTKPCDDSTYNNAQVHGDLSTGVASGSHTGTSTYEGGTVNVTKAFGDCDHPSGAVSFSIGVSQSQFSGGRFGNYRGY